MTNADGLTGYETRAPWDAVTPITRPEQQTLELPMPVKHCHICDRATGEQHREDCPYRDQGAV